MLKDQKSNFMFTVNEISQPNDDFRKKILNDGSMANNKELEETLNELREIKQIQIPNNVGITG